MYTSQLTAALVVLGAVAVQAVPSFPSDQHLAALLARQAPGSPKFECHSACGSVITGGRVEGHCDDSTWVANYKECLTCAQAENIWQFYGNSVGSAGTACGLSTVPAAEPAEETSTSAAAPAPAVTTTEDAPAATTDAPAATTDAPATDAPTTPSTPAPTAAPTDATTVPPVVGSNSTNSAPSSTSTFVTVSGGSQVAGSLVSVGLMVFMGLKAMW
ncbi:hypothetical protein GE09DRAFT_1275055 [Coniochaeta sp. 2T2.1]|nr:hypothetical protein GE09DRAFT_1275055 [Coniochaeta sp. 2T2.1]